jgi:hypothetical protein
MYGLASVFAATDVRRLAPPSGHWTLIEMRFERYATAALPSVLTVNGKESRAPQPAG